MANLLTTSIGVAVTSFLAGCEWITAVALHEAGHPIPFGIFGGCIVFPVMSIMGCYVIWEKSSC